MTLLSQQKFSSNSFPFDQLQWMYFQIFHYKNMVLFHLQLFTREKLRSLLPKYFDGIVPYTVYAVCTAIFIEKDHTQTIGKN